MSRTTCIKCLECLESLWVGQSVRLYGTEEHIKALNLFLINHEEHVLKFGDDDFILTYKDEELHFDEEEYLKHYGLKDISNSDFYNELSKLEANK